MTKTIEDVQRLSAFFAPEDHEWLSGKTYIKEDKITARLDEIDPDWEFILAGCQRNGNSVSAYGTLIVCGVRRDGVGMDVARVKGEVEVNEAEKSAATDALKRAARLHGIGRYLLDLPKSVTDEKTLRDWMKAQKQTKPVQSTAPARRIPEEPAQQQAQDVSALTPAEAGEPATIEWFRTLLDTYNISSKEALKLLDVAKLSQWTSTLGIAENLIRTKIEVDRAHNENQQQRQPNNAEIKTSEPVDKITIKRDKHGKGYAVAAGITFYSRELWTEAGITFSEFSETPPDTYELSVRVKIQYVVENGFKKPVKIELA